MLSISVMADGELESAIMQRKKQMGGSYAGIVRHALVEYFNLNTERKEVAS